MSAPPAHPELAVGLVSWWRLATGPEDSHGGRPCTNHNGVVFTGDAAHFATQSYDYAVRRDGPLAYWRLGESSGTIAHDPIGGYDGTISGAVTLGQPAAVFNGGPSMAFAGGRIDAGAIAAANFGAGSFTIEAWVYRTAGGAWQTVVGKGGSTGVPGWRAFISSADTLMLFWGSDGEPYPGGSTVLTPNVWHHCVWGYDAAAAAVFYAVDGVTQIGATANHPVSNSAPVTIGAGSDGGYPVAGTIDQVAIYPRALTPSEIADHYARRQSYLPPWLEIVDDVFRYDNRPFTVACWMQMPPPEPTYYGVLSATSLTAGSWYPGGWAVYVNPNPTDALETRGYLTSTTYGASNQNTVADAWALISVSYDPSTGALRTTTRRAGAAPVSTSATLSGYLDHQTGSPPSLWLGRAYGVVTHPGQLKRAAYWQRVLSDGDCEAYFNGGAGLEYDQVIPPTRALRDGLVGYWRLATDATDAHTGHRDMSPYGPAPTFTGDAANLSAGGWLATPPSYRATVIQDSMAGVCAYWSLDETSGTIAHARRGPAGTISGGVTLGVESLPAGTRAMRFDGIDGHIHIPPGAYSAFGTASATVECLIRGPFTATAIVVATGNLYAVETAFGFFVTTEYLYVQARDADNVVGLGSAPAVLFADGQWHHIAGVLRRDTTPHAVELWVDGIMRASVAAPPGNLTNGTSGTYIGYPFSAGYTGDIDEVALYPLALTAAQIAAHAALALTGPGSDPAFSSQHAFTCAVFGITPQDGSGPHPYRAIASNGSFPAWAMAFVMASAPPYTNSPFPVMYVGDGSYYYNQPDGRLGDWALWVFRFNPATLTFRCTRNGVDAVPPYTLPALPNDGDGLAIGREYSGLPWLGHVKRAAFWNRELTDAEVGTYFNGGAGLDYEDIWPPIGPVQPTIEAESAPNVWTDISGDLVIDPIQWERGISGSGPLDRLARPGTFTFTLDNTAENTHGLADYYTPGHPNAPSWWRHGTRVRLHLSNGPVERYIMRGRLHQIEPDPIGLYDARLVRCVARDWMDVFAATDVITLPLRINVAADVLFGTLVDQVSDVPANLVLDPGIETYEVAFDDLGETQPKAPEVAQDLAQSDLGFFYVRGDDTDGETVRFENRLGRIFTEPLHTFVTEDLPHERDAIEVPSTLEDLVNDVEVQVVPRRVDPAANVVLIRLDAAVLVGAGQVVTIEADYKDPLNEAEFVGAANMLQPGLDQDWTANTAEDGSGSNVSAGLDVVGFFWGSRATLELHNDGVVAVWFRGPPGQTGLQARGRGVYGYRPIGVHGTNPDSIAHVGRRQLDSPLLMPYQSDLSVGQSLATFLANLYSAMRTPVAFRIANDDDVLTEQCIVRDIGDCVAVPADDTPVPVAIHSLSGELTVERRLTMRYRLGPVDIGSVLILDDPERGELDANALGY
jgi:hypothetical protein